MNDEEIPELTKALAPAGNCSYCDKEVRGVDLFGASWYPTKRYQIGEKDKHRYMSIDMKPMHRLETTEGMSDEEYDEVEDKIKLCFECWQKAEQDFVEREMEVSLSYDTMMDLMKKTYNLCMDWPKCSDKECMVCQYESEHQKDVALGKYDEDEEE